MRRDENHHSGKNPPTAQAIIEAAAAPANKVLYNVDLFEARVYITPDQEEGVTFDNNTFHVYLQNKDSNPSLLVTQWLRQKAAEVLPQKTKEWAEKIGVEYYF